MKTSKIFFNYRHLVSDPVIQRFINSYKIKNSEEIFAGEKFNFALFQHCLQKVSSELNREGKSKIQLNFSQSLKNYTSYYYILLAGIFVFSVAVLFFAKYYSTNFQIQRIK